MFFRKDTIMHIRRTLDVLTTSIPGALLFVFLYASGCGNPVSHVSEFPAGGSTGVRSIYGPSGQPFYKMIPGDVINVKFTYHPEQDMKAPIPIRPDGNITLEGIGSTEAAGLAPEQLAKTIAEKSSGRLKDPEVIVTVVQFAPRKVYVGGEVKTPGVIEIKDKEGMTPLQAIFDRGGFTNTAQVDSVILIRDAASGNPKIGRINIHQSMEDAVPERLVLLPNDVLYVPMTGVGRAVEWVRQHIRELIPWEILSIGSYGSGFR
jgi:polysaccharide export outer membrane protein